MTKVLKACYNVTMSHQNNQPESYASVVDWAVRARGMKLGQPTAEDAQKDTSDHLDGALGVVRQEAASTPEGKRPARLRKVGRAAAQLAIAAAAATGLGLAINQVGEARIFHPDEGNPADTDHSREVVPITGGGTVIVERSNAHTGGSEPGQ